MGVFAFLAFVAFIVFIVGIIGLIVSYFRHKANKRTWWIIFFASLVAMIIFLIAFGSTRDDETSDTTEETVVEEEVVAEEENEPVQEVEPQEAEPQEVELSWEASGAYLLDISVDSWTDDSVTLKFENNSGDYLIVFLVNYYVVNGTHYTIDNEFAGIPLTFRVDDEARDIFFSADINDGESRLVTIVTADGSALPDIQINYDLSDAVTMNRTNSFQNLTLDIFKTQ